MHFAACSSKSRCWRSAEAKLIYRNISTASSWHCAPLYTCCTDTWKHFRSMSELKAKWTKLCSKNLSPSSMLMSKTTFVMIRSIDWRLYKQRIFRQAETMAAVAAFTQVLGLLGAVYDVVSWHGKDVRCVREFRNVQCRWRRLNTFLHLYNSVSSRYPSNGEMMMRTFG